MFCRCLYIAVVYKSSPRKATALQTMKGISTSPVAAIIAPVNVNKNTMYNNTTRTVSVCIPVYVCMFVMNI